MGDRQGLENRQERVQQRPEQRENWSERSENRNDQWQERVTNRNEAWNKRSDRRQESRQDFQQNRDERWDNLEDARGDRQDWRDQNREDWQDHREDLWDYRGDRAEEIWDDVGDWHDDLFDDRWWGGYGLGYYPANPWWWWGAAGWAAATAFVQPVVAEPVYIDYGMNVIYEGDTVHVDGEPVPVAEYTQPVVDLVETMEDPPPPAPPAEGKQPEWLPLGVFALAEEKKGDPVMFFQISVNRDGVISGGFESTITGEQKPIAGQVDKKTQQAAWRVGDNTDVIFITSLANLTQDVSTIAIRFGETRTSTWLLVRLPEPAAAGEEQKLPEAPQSPPKLTKVIQ